MQRLLFAVMLFACLIPAFGQAPAPVAAKTLSPNPIPDSVLFHFFFLHVASVEKAANSLKAQGKDDTIARGYFKSRAGLTDVETSLLKELAASCNADFATQSQAAVAQVNQLRAQYGQPSSFPPAGLQRIKDLDAQRNGVITDCQQRLQTGMGAARYQRLYAFVRQTESPAVKRTAPAAQK